MNHFLLIKGSAGTVPLPSRKGEGLGGREGEFAGVWREEEEGLEETECEATQEEQSTKKRLVSKNLKRENHWHAANNPSLERNVRFHSCFMTLYQLL